MKMIFDVITLFPELIEGYCELGVVGRAHQKGSIETRCWNPRQYTTDIHHTVDDRPYGGGPGMVMKYQPLKDAFDEIKETRAARGFRIYLSPRGRLLDQQLVQTLSEQSHIVLLCGRYEGVDERIIDSEIDLELSIGDYVLSGGELAANVVIDSVARLLPDVLSNHESFEQDSFSNGLLDCPHYTRPEEINGMRVPDVLLSGNHKNIAKWRTERSIADTQERRPDLWEKLNLHTK
ncbi:tRNA (guanine-N(1)-)-methyltransferase [Wohlfahrtiimonas chitiniclastica SH04]|uniref:tRNA (guanine-N(1)-)-methyltransferase n=2 Tax=Wohlfahrtiimonas chitiniclastica TaxID=400946 RepID=L8XX35_9GAMM|nr:tRNA (guanosine(37)-N1)-methyltransferase TrmD [Wohlfahrtiimonas chitiniclastica]ELV07325.1 tRNA (guanine-N(1)-)-methyltransferase [Wohlfahrtiimonas chitiniclastica SH04]OYQ70806.1 tRNA (guanosine(37)-N1)-methyltransferase TrmD [Wohlfahrtiimonas chitiniclastica]OYQ74656.1 tRNA (guanosine(37)-N1)-methyltransferase TrmD [Wohlfahrtiimonas chitiniclastica]OYQ84013.1 tRNA (guanosine(37)-N1)-methyltransferase TrmD [Wohlfahrtiimonas chitiniclastica]OYQ84852.1 tRNA (guanosine(37)-N1)-methyltransfer